MMQRIFYHNLSKLADKIGQYGYEEQIKSNDFWRCINDDLFVCEMPIDAGDGNRLIPSLSVINGNEYSYRCVYLNDDDKGHASYLHLIGDDEISIKEISEVLNVGANTFKEDPNIDYFGNIKASGRLFVFCRVKHSNLFEKASFLLSVTIQANDGFADAIAKTNDNAKNTVPALSQFDVDHPDNYRVCLPVCTTMLLNYFGKNTSCDQSLAALYDREMDNRDVFPYGIWPRSAWFASRYNIIGYVSAFDNWSDVVALLKRKIPIIASVTYDEGELTNGAVSKTSGGHLIIITGIDGDRVLVNDPAGKPVSEVIRTYDVKEFEKVWFKNKGGVCLVFFAN